ncbi:COG3650 family protein [Paracoccus sp. Ld10]|uniref:COG3650 family protein n=1 Tax=Paracoccus sp. Ld10 TaxID=649158 RepID=UPI0038705D0E
MFPRLAILALMTLPLAACDSQMMTDLRSGVGLTEAEAQPEEPAGPRPPAVSPLEQPIETGTVGRVVPTAEPMTYRTTAFVAGGNEPFWTVEVSGNTAVYRTADDQSGRQIQVNRLVFNEGVEYIGVLGGRPFVLNLRAAECQDNMADKRYPLTARLTVSGQGRPGCASAAQTPAPAAGAATDTAPAAAG